MDFRYAKPMITAKEEAELLSFVEVIKPEAVEASGIEQVFALIGRATVGNYAIPAQVRPWIDALPRGVVILARISAQAVICNANYIMAKRVEQAIFALVGYTWLYKDTP